MQKGRDYSSFGDLFLVISILITFDNWPYMAKPILKDSSYYLFYFIPFVMINLLFLYPIPIALLFDSFRLIKSRELVNMRLSRKQALMISFSCIDYGNEGQIRYSDWHKMLQETYGDRISREGSKTSFIKLTGNLHGTLTLQDYLKLDVHLSELD